ncbi:MAG TPA: type I glutamate--ammonia ligase [Nitrososphaeraceae archaeon]|jgi:glutamine synthetase|nr:type I glutamate--ammonia ligase [Nitrososphaeraceae archaeon]
MNINKPPNTNFKNEINGYNDNLDDNSSNIEFIQIRYTDVIGKFLAKYFQTEKSHIYEIFRTGIGLDGSSVKGFSTIDESDMLLLPDRTTERKINLSNNRITTVIADVYRGFNQGRSSRDPRYVSQKMEDYLAMNQITCQVGAEVECFVFDEIIFSNNLAAPSVEEGEGNPIKKNLQGISSNQDPTNVSILSTEQVGNGKYPIRPKSGYDTTPFQDSLTDFRFEIARILKKYYSIEVTNLNHEVASNGQIEINFMHDILTKTADNVQLYKDVVRNVAKKYNKIANFMPKPIFEEHDPTKGDNGSGMHVSVSFWKKSTSRTNNSNIFYDSEDSYSELSQVGRYFIGGLLDHAPSLSALVTPTVNSYYRIIPGFEAPVYVAWARGNRSAVVRIPVNAKGNDSAKRIEFRAPDPSSNSYLAFSAIVAAGLDGIKNKIDPGNPINENIYKMSEHKRKSFGINMLPSSLDEALMFLKSDSKYLNICFEKPLIDVYISLKLQEIAEIGIDKSKLKQFLYYYDV